MSYVVWIYYSWMSPIMQFLQVERHSQRIGCIHRPRLSGCQQGRSDKRRSHQNSHSQYGKLISIQPGWSHWYLTLSHLEHRSRTDTLICTRNQWQPLFAPIDRIGLRTGSYLLVKMGLRRWRTIQRSPELLERDCGCRQVAESRACSSKICEIRVEVHWTDPICRLSRQVRKLSQLVELAHKHEVIPLELLVCLPHMKSGRLLVSSRIEPQLFRMHLPSIQQGHIIRPIQSI